jgi:lipoprotein-anchoring transpeptidase ErfK/SrfK
MEQGHSTGRSRRTGWTARVAVGTAAGVAAMLALTACSGGGGGSAGDPAVPTPGGSSTSSAPSGGASSTSSAPQAVAEAAVISSSPTPDSTGVSPSTPVVVKIANGKLTSVVMTNPSGKKVTGAIAADGASWQNTEDLGYGKTYSIVAKGTNADGKPTTKTEKVTTLTPNNMTAVYMDRTGDYALDNGATYGVAILPELRFDEQIVSKADKLAAEKAVTVTTSPHVAGAWAWNDDYRMYYRPASYWPSGTKVTIDAKIYGVKLGNGLYGQSDKKVSFTVGRKQVTIATDSAPKSVNKVRVYNAAGKVIKTMNTSMGQHGGVTVNGNYINFYTLDGTYTVLEHDNPAYMSSDSYGLPSSNPQGYAREPIYYSTKISVDGIYLHELTTTEWAQNSGQDVSHGCLNLSTANASWFYNHSIVGDPVEVKGAKGAPKIQVWQGGGWSVPWSAWTSGDISKY